MWYTPRMYSLSTIVRMNRAAPKAVESETTRHCSFNETPLGIILHSAKQRNTVCITHPKARKAFKLAYYSTNSIDKTDALIESYFN